MQLMITRFHVLHPCARSALNEWSFGQVLPMIILLAPLYGVIDYLSSKARSSYLIPTKLETVITNIDASQNHKHCSSSAYYWSPTSSEYTSTNWRQSITTLPKMERWRACSSADSARYTSIHLVLPSTPLPTDLHRDRLSDWSFRGDC